MLETTEKWAELTIKRWLFQIAGMDIGSTGGLVKSFYFHVNTDANGDVSKVLFAFNYYGKFTDMGVGKGVLLVDRDRMEKSGDTKREPKPWFTSVFYAQLGILAKELAQREARKTGIMIKINLEAFDIGGVRTSKSRSSGKSGKSFVSEYDRLHGN